MARVGGKVRADEFNKAVQEVLDEYAEYISSTVISKAIEETAKDTAEAVAAKAPVDTGEYKASITYGEKKRARNKCTMTVYADAPGYSITHLLEKSHALRNGGRSTPQEHWGPAYDNVGDVFEKHLKENL